MTDRTVKPVSFGSDDSDLLLWVQGRNFSRYVKDLIRQDMKSASVPQPLLNSTILDAIRQMVGQGLNLPQNEEAVGVAPTAKMLNVLF